MTTNNLPNSSQSIKVTNQKLRMMMKKRKRKMRKKKRKMTMKIYCLLNVVPQMTLIQGCPLQIAVLAKISHHLAIALQITKLNAKKYIRMIRKPISPLQIKNPTSRLNPKSAVIVRNQKLRKKTRET
ncbi:hypothetical protein X975_15003, partial [Stegodyphus mimosarum]